MKENSPLKELCPQKKITNHNARKTIVKKLKSSGVPKCEIKNIIGHALAQGLDDYDSGDEREQQMISRIIDNNGAGPSRGILSQLYPANSSISTLACAPGHVYNFSNCSVTLNIAGNDAVQKSSSDISVDTSVSSLKNQILSDFSMLWKGIDFIFLMMKFW